MSELRSGSPHEPLRLRNPTGHARDGSASRVATLWLGGRRSTRGTKHASRYGKHWLHAALLQPGDAHDAWAGLLLRWPRRPEERPGHHDPELRLHGLDDGALVGLRLLP